MSPRSIGAAIDLEAQTTSTWSTTLRHHDSRSIIATSLLLGALSCSDDASDTPANGGSAGAGQSGSAGSNSSGSGGSAGSSAAGSSGSGGTSGAAGTANLAGAGGTGDGDAGFPAPDKLVALSFDDGPDATATTLVLDKLEAHGVPASFFLIGQQIGADDAAVLTRAAALGCEFENHSQGFGALDTADADAINTSINSTNTAIFNATGQNAVFFRPPNLATSALMFSTITMPFAGGLLGNDFPGGNCGAVPSVDCVSNNILNGVVDGTIILLHDVQPLPHPTPEALDIIIPALKQRGFEIVTLRTLFARRDVDPNSQEILWASVPPSN